MSDGWENWMLFDIQAAFTAGDYSPAMASLSYPVAAKFVLLALTNVAIGLALARLGSRWWVLAGTLVIVACVPALMAIAVPSHYGWTLLAATGGGWMALFGTAAIANWRALVQKRAVMEVEPLDERPLSAPAVSASSRPTFGRRRV